MRRSRRCSLHPTESRSASRLNECFATQSELKRTDVDQWGWSCGFHGLNPGQHRYGTAATFDEARAGFEADWQTLQPEIPKDAFDEWRHDRKINAEIRAKRDRGEKLDSEIPSSIMRCICGIRFDSHKPAESYDHRQHLYAAQAERTR